MSAESDVTIRRCWMVTQKGGRVAQATNQERRWMRKLEFQMQSDITVQRPFVQGGGQRMTA